MKKKIPMPLAIITILVLTSLFSIPFILNTRETKDEKKLKEDNKISIEQLNTNTEKEEIKKEEEKNIEENELQESDETNEEENDKNEVEVIESTEKKSDIVIIPETSKISNDNKQTVETNNQQSSSNNDVVKENTVVETPKVVVKEQPTTKPVVTTTQPTTVATTTTTTTVPTTTKPKVDIYSYIDFGNQEPTTEQECLAKGARIKQKDRDDTFAYNEEHMDNQINSDIINYECLDGDGDNLYLLNIICRSGDCNNKYINN